MSKKYSYDELVVLKQEGKIGWLEFVKEVSSHKTICNGVKTMV